MRVVAVLNQKGGVGKTTTVVNLGAALALRDERVLLVDLDPQANLTDHLGIEPGEDQPTAYDVLRGESTAAAAIVPAATPNLSVLPGHEDLAALEHELADTPGREARLKSALAALPPTAYDWVLVDCPPSLGLLTLNALAAAREVLIALQTEYFALRGLGQIDRIVELVRSEIHPGLKIAGIIPTLVDPITNLAREVLDEVKRVYGHKVFDTRIRKNVRLAEAPGHRQHVFAYAPESAGAADYHALAEEVLGLPDPDAKGAPARKRVRVPVAIPVEPPVKTAPPPRTERGRFAPRAEPAPTPPAPPPPKAAPPKPPPAAQAPKPAAAVGPTPPPRPPAPPAPAPPKPRPPEPPPAAKPRAEAPAPAARPPLPGPRPPVAGAAPPPRPPAPVPAAKPARPAPKPGGGA